MTPLDTAGSPPQADCLPSLPEVHRSVAVPNAGGFLRKLFAFMGPEHAPVAEVGDQWLKVMRTRLDPADGIRVECADGPIWIVESAPAEPPAIRR